MFASWSIKKRLIVSVSALSLAGVGILSFISYQNQMSQLRDGLQDQTKNEGRLFRSILAADAEGLSRAHIGLDRLDGLLRPFAAGHKDELLAVARPIFNEIRQHNISQMLFIEPDGRVLLRVHHPEQSGDRLNRATFLKARAGNGFAGGLEMGTNQFCLRCVRPVFAGGRMVGYLELAEGVDQVFRQMKEVSGCDASLFLRANFPKNGGGLKGDQVGPYRMLFSTQKEIAAGLAGELLPEMQGGLHGFQMSIVSFRGEKYAVGIEPVLDASGATVGVLFSHREVTPLFAELWGGVAANLAVLICILFGALFLLYLALRKSLLLFGTLNRHIIGVTTTWDLTRPLAIDTNDEIGALADDFNSLTGKLSEMVRQVNSCAGELGQVSSSLLLVSGSVMGAAEQQTEAVEAASLALTQMNGSLKGVAQGVEVLSESAADSAAAIVQMALSVQEVAVNTESLAQSVDEVGSAITEIAASVRQVGENADLLMDAASVNASSIAEMDCSIKEVEKNALETVAISEGVRGDAEVGKKAVESTILGMGAIRDSSRITSEVIANLAKRAGDIGAILQVIDDVAEQTNLLALNAAIIAAQAGEYGKGFAVVAGEIKQLAQRTSSSTRKISEVVTGVLDETGRAVKAIAVAEQNIAEGETLSRRSGEALEKIVGGAQMATDQVKNIARATAEQSRGSKMIRDATERVTTMVRQIAISTREQGNANKMVLSAVEGIKSMTDQVKLATREQSSVGGQIARSTEKITDMIWQIKGACDEQSRGGDGMLPAFASIEVAARSNLAAMKVLGETTAALAVQIEALQREIGRFETGRG